MQSQDPMDNIRAAVEHADKNPSKVVSYSWYLVLIFAAVDVLVALINASTNDSSANGSHAASFASVWTLFMVLGVSVAGTVILKKYHTPLAVGTLLGLTTMMSQFMFVLFAVFLALAEYADEPGLATGDRTMAVFSFFLFLLYGLFSFVLGRYRTTVMNTPGTASSNDEGEWQDEPGTDGMAPGTPV
ncbi:conserved unknown protein [Ectocarpus siliculosus]|uniref:Uncharacterized protein n=1 Tax=Ectocarpus siliculosus TaxID=2880 RepID=D7FX95_ECTSI|nr:conserved unknown protein [Ectocarpus siliculosus]|eukprot:CBJ49273.1 conserved unknown protein [Ectocarpus siliculosus]